MIEFMIYLIGTGIFVWVVYKTFANDWATIQIHNKQQAISDFLAEYQYTLYRVCSSGYESPSEVKFTLIHDARDGLPSRVMYRKIQKAYRLRMEPGKSRQALDQIMTLCRERVRAFELKELKRKSL